MINLTIKELENKIFELEEKLNRLRICPSFETLTRAGLEDCWERKKHTPNLAIAYVDLDNLKVANSKLGMRGVNDRIKKAFSLIRSSESKTGRFFSGDEFVILASIEHIEKPCNRLLSKLKELELSATITIVKYLGHTELEDAVIDASLMNQICKRQGKGRIYSFL